MSPAALSAGLLQPRQSAVELNVEGSLLATVHGMAEGGTTLAVAASEAIQLAGRYFQETLLQLLEDPAGATQRRSILTLLQWYHKIRTAKLQTAFSRSAAPAAAAATSSTSGLPTYPQDDPKASSPAALPKAAASSSGSHAPAPLPMVDPHRATKTDEEERLLKQASFSFIVTAAQQQKAARPSAAGKAVEELLLYAIYRTVLRKIGAVAAVALDVAGLYAEWGTPAEDMCESFNHTATHLWECEAMVSQPTLLPLYTAAMRLGGGAALAHLPILGPLTVPLVAQWLAGKRAQAQVVVGAIPMCEL